MVAGRDVISGNRDRVSTSAVCRDGRPDRHSRWRDTAGFRVSLIASRAIAPAGPARHATDVPEPVRSDKGGPPGKPEELGSWEISGKYDFSS
jgi:hypothetical protein